MQRQDNSPDLKEIHSKTSFELMNRGGSSYRTHYVKDMPRQGKMVIAPTGYNWFFMFVFLFFTGFIFAVSLTSAGKGNLNSYVIPVIALVFFCIGLRAFYLNIFRSRSVFDFTENVFTQGKNRIPFSDFAALQVIEKMINSQISLRKKRIPFLDSAALQVIENTTDSQKSFFHVYELNLILKDCSRVNLLTHGNQKSFFEDTELLSRELHLPVWYSDGVSKESCESFDIRPKSDGVSKESCESFGTRPKSRKAIFLFSWMMVPFLIFWMIVPFVILYFSVGSPCIQCCRSRNWTEVPAVVVHSQLTKSRSSSSKGGEPTYSVDIQAEYEWEGRKYTCRNYDFVLSRMSSNVGVDNMKEIIRKHPAGAKTTCYVNPENPSESVMDREIHLNSFFLLPAVFCLLFLGVGVFLICRWKKQKDGQQIEIQ